MGVCCVIWWFSPQTVGSGRLLQEVHLEVYLQDTQGRVFFGTTAVGNWKEAGWGRERSLRTRQLQRSLASGAGVILQAVPYWG